MKKFLATLIALTITVSAYSGMTCSGTMNFNGGALWGDFLIATPGVLTAKDTKVYGLTIKGKADLDTCFVQGEIISYGNFLAKKTEFHSDMTLCAGNVILDSCKAPNIYIYNIDDSPLEIHLKGNCIIEGSIAFDEGTAKVYKGPEVSILGEVINGTIIDEE